MSNEPESTERAQQRERLDPSEQNRPIPAIVVVAMLTAVIAGVSEILFSEPFGTSEFGDRRRPADLNPDVAQAGQVVDGKQLFSANCVACHQATGLGLAGVFPPLAGSEWVTGDERLLANILLHGIDGEITVQGKVYRGVMPPFGQLGDAELAALASHIRNTWSNKATPLTAERFAQERGAQPRSAPYSGGDELKALIDTAP